MATPPKKPPPWASYQHDGWPKWGFPPRNPSPPWDLAALTKCAGEGERLSFSVAPAGTSSSGHFICRYCRRAGLMPSASPETPPPAPKHPLAPKHPPSPSCMLGWEHPNPRRTPWAGGKGVLGAHRAVFSPICPYRPHKWCKAPNPKSQILAPNSAKPQIPNLCPKWCKAPDPKSQVTAPKWCCLAGDPRAPTFSPHNSQPACTDAALPYPKTRLFGTW